ncbi:MAG: hypothetical protein ACE5MH_07250 [Terriglobia bacterium]
MADYKAMGTGPRVACGVTFLAAFAAVAVLAQQPPPTPAQPARRPPAQQTQQSPRQATPPAQAPTRVAGPLPQRPGGRRDPFRSLLVRTGGLGEQGVCPPAQRKPGPHGRLLIGQIRVEGIVLTPTVRLAVVIVPNRPAYFLREQDELCNGYVAEIHEDQVIFKEWVKDAFGKPFEREVVKPLISPAGATR